MIKKRVAFVSLFSALLVYLFSFYFYKSGFRAESKIMGQKSEGGYLIPEKANLVTLNKSEEGRESLTFSTELSKDQVVKFYEELVKLGTKKEFSCVKDLAVVEESKGIKLVTVNFCK